MKRYIRKRFLIGLAVLVVLLATGYVTLRVMIDPEAIRLRAEQTLSGLLDAEVTIARARFDPVLGLTIEDLTIRVPNGDDGSPSKVFANVPRVKLTHQLKSLFSHKLRYRDITIHDAEIYLERSADGRSNIDRIITALKRSAEVVEVYPNFHLERTRFHYVDHALADRSGQPLTGRFEQVTGTLVPLNSGERKFRANVSGKDPELGLWTIRDATFDTSAATVAIHATSSRIPVNGKLRERLGGRGRAIWDTYSPSGGTVQVDARLTYDGAAAPSLDYEVRLLVEETSASDRRFPYRFEEINGTVICREEGVELSEVVGHSGDMSATFNGKVFGYGKGCPTAVRIVARHVPLDAKLRAALSEDRKQVWDDLAPTGTVDMVCRLDRKVTGERTRVRVLVGNHPGTRVATRYRPFPYPLDLEGWALYDAGTIRVVDAPPADTTLEALKPGVLLAHRGATIVEASGGIEHGEPFRLIDMDFRVRKGCTLPLDDTLKTALPASMRELWETLSLSGTTRGRCEITRANPKEERLDVVVELTDLATQVCCRDFPYTIEDPAGSVVYERRAGHSPDGRLLIRGLRFEQDETSVAIDGEMSGFHAGKPVDRMDLNIRAAGLPLDDKLRRATPKSCERVWEYLSPTPESRVNVVCKLERPRPGMERADFRLEIDSIDTSLMCADFPYRVDHLKGRAEFTRNTTHPDGELRLRELTSTDGERKVRVSGLLTGFASGKKIDRVQMTIEGASVPMDAKLRAALDEKYRKVFDALHPEGNVDVSCALRRAAREKDLGVDVSIRPRDAAVTYDKLPLKVSDVDGHIVLARGEVRLKDLRGHAAGGTVRLDGVLHRREGNGLGLTVLAKNVVLDDTIAEVLPEAQQKLWRALKLRGKLTFHGTVRKVREGPDKGQLVYKGVLLPEGVSLQAGLVVENITGSVQVSGTRTAEEHCFSGKASLATLTVKKHTLRKVTAEFDKRANHFRVHKLEGKVHGGDLAAQLRVQLGEPVDYGLVIDAKSLHLGRLLRTAFGVKDGRLSGELSGAVRLQGTGDDTGTLVGEADLKVRRGRLWEVPPVLALLKVLNLSFPERTAFTDANAALAFYGKRVHVHRLDLIGNAISVYGKGIVEPTGAVSLSFETGFGRIRLPAVPIVSDVVRGMQQQLISVKMGGTLRKPKLEIVPIVPIAGPVMGIVDVLSPPKMLVKERE